MASQMQIGLVAYVIKDLPAEYRGVAVAACDVAWLEMLLGKVHYHFVRERVLDGDIDLTYVRTDEQVADIFTKALGAEKLRQF